MNKEIKYGGYSASPGDHEALEGDLAVAMNLIPEHNTIRPVLAPSSVFDNSLPDGYSVMCIHKVGDTINGKEYKLNYILWCEGNNSLYRLYEDGTFPYDGGCIWTFAAGVTVHKVEPVGNTLVVLASDGMHYILFKKGIYRYLGTHIPELDLQFELTDAKEYESDEHKVEWDVSGYGDMFPDLTTPMSFFDGAEIYDNSVADEGKEVGAKLRQAIMASLNEAVADACEEKRFAFPFFVRYGFRMYDDSESITMHSAPVLLVPTLNTPTLSMGWAGISHDGTKVKSPAKVKASLMGYRLHCRPLDVSQLQELAKWSDIVSSVDIFISPQFYTYKQGAKDREIKLDTPSVKPPVNTMLNSQVCDNGAFYLVKQVRLSSDNPQHNKLLQQGGDYVDIDFEPTNDNIVTRELMTDDYGTHDELMADKSFAYNSRINLAGVSKRLFNGFNPGCMWHKVGDTSSSTTTATVVVEVDSREIVVRSQAGVIFYAPRSANKVLWFFYPHPGARHAYLTVDGQQLELELNPHPMLNGAYYCSLDEEAEQSTAPYILNPSSDEDRIVEQPDKVYTSEVNNPFYFPVVGINTIGGTVLGLCAAVRPVSTSQYGYADLYIFSDGGIWTAKINDKGSYSDITLATGDVCTDPDSITQMETSVLFATARGIMLISGSQAQCISEVIDDHGQQAPGLQEITGTIAPLLGLTVNVQPFSVYRDGMRMIYDYPGQRIIVCNPQYSYAYVYSLESNKWGMMWSNIQYTIKDYPNALAVTSDGDLVNFSSPSSESSPSSQLLVTRPLTLELPDVLKTVTAVLQRGLFRKHQEHVKCALYGSRDLYNWHVVASSKDENMRGFRGTPYKWFRVALLLQLPADESVTGCSIQFEQRQTNRLR